MILEDHKLLFHGSYTVVSEPDLQKCMKYKDFGQGFYVTTDIKQANRFVKSAIGKAVKNGITVPNPNKGYVTRYEYVPKNGLLIHVFESADSEWLHCVAAHRKEDILIGEIEKWNKYDIIIGKIANDNTNQVITAYINGLYGKVGSEQADRIAIGLLEPERLTDQVCIRTANGLEVLVYKDFDEITI